MRKEVKYLDTIVGYSYNEKTIEFLDTKEANIVKEMILKNKHIGISARRLGTTGGDSIYLYPNIQEYAIIINNEH